MNRLAQELTRVFGDPPSYPRAVVRLQVGTGQGIDAGREEADRIVDAGCELVVLDSDATGSGVRACLAVLLDLEPVQVTDRGAPDWSAQVVEVRGLVRTARPHVGDPVQLLDALADDALGRLVGLVERLTERRTPVLLGGGTAVAAAVLVVTRRAPEAERWLLAGSTPDDAHARDALTAAGLSPLLDLGLGPTGADVAVGLVRAGLEVLGA